MWLFKQCKTLKAASDDKIYIFSQTFRNSTLHDKYWLIFCIARLSSDRYQYRKTIDRFEPGVRARSSKSSLINFVFRIVLDSKPISNYSFERLLLICVNCIENKGCIDTNFESQMKQLFRWVI